MGASWVLWSACVLVLILIWRSGPVDSNGDRPLITAHSIVVTLIVFYVIVPAFFLILAKGSFTWAPAYGGPASLEQTIFILLLGLVGYFLGCFRVRPKNVLLIQEHGSIRTSGSDRSDYSSDDARRSGVAPEYMAVLALLIIGLAFKGYLILRVGGFEQTALRLSGSVSQSFGFEAPTPFENAILTLSGMADAAATWMLMRMFQRGRFLTPWLFVWLLTVSLSYLIWGKRLSLLLPAFAVLISFHVYKHYLSARLFPFLLIGSFVVGFGTLMFRIFLPAYLSHVTIDLTQVAYAGGSLMSFYTGSLEFSTVEMVAVVASARSDILAMFGGYGNTLYELFLAPALYTIPRAVWPSKPGMTYDLSYAVSSIISGTRVSDSTIGYVATIFGAGFVLGSYVGVVVSLFALARFVRWVDKVHLLRDGWSPTNILGYAFLMACTFHLFRMGTVAWTFILAGVNQYGFLLGWGLLAVVGSGRGSRVSVQRPVLHSYRKRGSEIGLGPSNQRDGGPGERGGLDD